MIGGGRRYQLLSKGEFTENKVFIFVYNGCLLIIDDEDFLRWMFRLDLFINDLCDELYVTDYRRDLDSISFDLAEKNYV